MTKIIEFFINGKNFYDIGGFYDEFEKVFLKNYPKEFKFGRNLDALDDILYLDEKEKKYKWVIVWKKFDKSRSELPKDFLRNILEIIRKHKNIKFKMED